MAVNDVRAEAEQLNRFWPRYHHITLFRAVSVQLLLCILVVSIILALYPHPPIGAWIVIGILGILAMSASVFVTIIAMRPLKDLSSALVYISGGTKHPDTPKSQ